MPPLAKAICRSTARTATKAAMASPTIHPIPPGPQGRGSPASRPGAARDFTKPSPYGTLGAVKRQWPFWCSRQVSPERIPWLCCPAGRPGSWFGSPRRRAEPSRFVRTGRLRDPPWRRQVPLAGLSPAFALRALGHASPANGRTWFAHEGPYAANSTHRRHGLPARLGKTPGAVTCRYIHRPVD
jgi:hypothetical protein